MVILTIHLKINLSALWNWLLLSQNEPRVIICYTQVKVMTHELIKMRNFFRFYFRDISCICNLKCWIVLESLVRTEFRKDIIYIFQSNKFMLILLTTGHILRASFCVH